MHNLLIPSLLFSTVLACQTKHQSALDAVDDFADAEEMEQDSNPDAGEGAKAKKEEGTNGDRRLSRDTPETVSGRGVAHRGFGVISLVVPGAVPSHRCTF